MNIKDSFRDYLKKRDSIQKLRNEIIDLRYDIDNFCESKVGYVVANVVPKLLDKTMIT